MSIRTARLALVSALALGALALPTADAQAAPAPWWHLTQRLIPSHLSPEGEGTLVVQAIDLGNRPTSGAYEIADTLPTGLELKKAEFFAPSPLPGVQHDLGPSGEHAELGLCQQSAHAVTCRSETSHGEPYLEPVPPYDFLEMKLKVKAEPGAESGPNRLSASGGAAPSASIFRQVPLSDEPIEFGLEHFSLTPEEEGGTVATRAGSHPYQLTSDVTLNLRRPDPSASPEAPAAPHNLHFRLPPGQIGNATVMPKCSATDFANVFGGGVNSCPPETAIGAAVVTAELGSAFSLEPFGGKPSIFIVPVFNLTPAPGEPARFGFEVLNNPVILDTSLRSGPGEDYGVDVDVNNITEQVNLDAATTTFWGTPQAQSHDESRGWGCIDGGHYVYEFENSGSGELPCEASKVQKPAAFLTLPTNCASPFETSVDGVSWPTKEAPGGYPFGPDTYSLADEAGNPLSLTACGAVPFNPTIESEPTSNAATTGTGLSFDIDVHDEGLENPEGIAQSQIKKTVVTLPEGFTIDASVAEGLHVCTEAEYEAATLEAGTGCREDSKIGEAEVESPLVEQKIKGSLYVAEQERNPYHNLTTLYLILRNPENGVLIRQALKVTPDPKTGQLVTEVDDIPQLPFSRFALSLRQGQRPPLITPPACGTYTVTAALYPWSAPGSPVHRESSFKITEGPEGKPCPGPSLPFHPGFEAGSSNNQAGSYSPFVLRLTRKDGEQDMTKFSAVLPPGVVGKIAGLAKCPQAAVEAAKHVTGRQQLANPSCPASSQIGRTEAGAGVGGTLVYVPGKLYLGGPYHGDPLSVIAIVPAVAGPFDVGDVVVQEALTLNPVTAEVEVDGAASDPIPHSLAGIPLNVRDIRVYTDRPEFTLNPTSCDESSTRATLWGGGSALHPTSEAPVGLGSRFQAAGCASLGFKPKLAIKLKGGTKRGRFPALKAVVTPRPGDANFANAVVTLPHSAFLEQGHFGTICTRAQFAAGAGNGSSCPAASIYGKARAWSPLLEEALEGPVYLRSSNHNLPDLVVALHGLVDVVLDARIDSVNGGIRSSFENIPDAPVSRFILEMQGGKKGLIVNSTDICVGKHKANAELTGQNGRLDDFGSKVTATCGKAKRHRKRHKAHRHATRHRKRGGDR